MARFSIYVPDRQLERLRHKFGERVNMSALCQLGLATAESVAMRQEGVYGALLGELHAINDSINIAEQAERERRQHSRRAKAVKQ